MRFFNTFLTLSIFVSLTQAADTSFLCGQLFQDQINFSNQIATPASAKTFTLVTWNMQKFENSKAFFDVKRISELADAIFIQESMHSDGWQNAFASHIPYSWNFFKSFCTDSMKATGVQIGSRYPLINNQIFISPVSEPVTFTPKATGFSQINIPGYGIITLVNTHALNFNSGDDFKIQMKAVAEKLKSISGPMIWAGDFNTWHSERLQFLKATAKELGLDLIHSGLDDRGLSLDHVFARGLEIVNSEILPEKTSDHRPLKVIFKLKSQH